MFQINVVDFINVNILILYHIFKRKTQKNASCLFVILHFLNFYVEELCNTNLFKNYIQISNISVVYQTPFVDVDMDCFNGAFEINYFNFARSNILKNDILLVVYRQETGVYGWLHTI